MRLERHVLLAIEANDRGEFDHALMHACLALEATAKNIYGAPGPGKRGDQYKDCIRKYNWLIEPMISAASVDLETLFTNLNIFRESGTPIPKPDFADVVWHVFRGNDAHGELIPYDYELLPVSDGISIWKIEDGKLKMPQRITWALLAVSIFSKANKGIITEGEHYIEWGSDILGIGFTEFLIKDWWGKEEEIRDFFVKQNLIKVKLENL